MSYTELYCLSCYSFLRGASHPHELVERAADLGYSAIAITDECSLAGVVKAHVAAQARGIDLIIGSELQLSEGIRLVALVPCRQAYSELSGLISMARRRSAKGEYAVNLRDVIFHLKRCLLIWLPEAHTAENLAWGQQLARLCRQRLWLGVQQHLGAEDVARYHQCYTLAKTLDIPMLACGHVLMHKATRKPLLDVFTALRHNCSVSDLGQRRAANSEQHLRPLETLSKRYPQALLQETLRVARRCRFSLAQLQYEYPEELVPSGFNANQYLRHLVAKGEKQRWPAGTPASIQQRIDQELALITELAYEYYFLTVYDIVQFARGEGILCQGRGSAANSVVCYCLFITEVSPENISLLFERFISKERDEPPDIDVDFEHERREEVIQYIYQKYSRKRAALTATVITYRSRSAVRDVGKALGLETALIDALAQSLAWWERKSDLLKRFAERGMQAHEKTATLFYELVQEIHGFPRHLSQHVGGFIITRNPISTLVPVENAAMPERTIIQWDKEDIEALGLLKVDVLALGMLSAIRKSLQYVSQYCPSISTVSDIPNDDSATYHMLQQADTIGVFQIESRAQMSMLPRLRPACFYDLVIQIAIVRPGPIQGDMVHPFLRRRNGEEKDYDDDKPEIKAVLQRTLGVPIFQEQVIKLAMVAAGFSGGEADQLRRAISNWGKNSRLLEFEEKLVHGMTSRGYDTDFAHRLFEQIKGFGGYGFPESHSASFALLAYISAWLKCHHPAAFYVGLLNSQPMGFYSPSQLVQDARRHQVVVWPVDVNHSQWDHQLLTVDKQAPHIRLGLRLIKQLSHSGAQQLIQQRKQQHYRSIADLQQRTSLSSTDMQALASADALKHLGGHRRQSQWQIMALQAPRPLLAQEQQLDDNIQLPSPSEAANVLADYHSTGLTLRSHPMALLRSTAPFSQCHRHSDLPMLGNRRFVRIAGLVTCRQRPGTASGVLFLTLEDETGNSNIVVWPGVQQRCRQALVTSKLLLVKGVVESRDNVIHVIAGVLMDYSDHLKTLALKSRDFH